MRYTKSELRDTRMPLLKRIQRQIDKREEKQPVLVSPQFASGEELLICGLEPIKEKVSTKKTKLHLYKKRGGR